MDPLGQQILLHPRRVALPEFLDWAQAHLQPTDAVVLEASVNVSTSETTES
jgi:hypothetical protein